MCKASNRAGLRGQLSAAGVLIGCVGCVIITASSVYTALKMGALPWPTIFTSLTALVLLRALGHRSLNEANITQVIMSAGSMVAGGLAFTIPGIWILQNAVGAGSAAAAGAQASSAAEGAAQAAAQAAGPALPGVLAGASWPQMLAVALAGTLLGLVCTALIRRHFVDESSLEYPIGTAAAETLLASRAGGALGRRLFGSMAAAGIWTVARDVLGVIPAMVGQLAIPGVAMGVQLSPMRMAVGFLVGGRSLAYWFGGAVFAAFGITVGGTALGLWDTAAAQGIVSSLGMGLMMGSGAGVVAKDVVWPALRAFARARKEKKSPCYGSQRVSGSPAAPVAQGARATGVAAAGAQAQGSASLSALAVPASCGDATEPAAPTVPSGHVEAGDRVALRAAAKGAGRTAASTAEKVADHVAAGAAAGCGATASAPVRTWRRAFSRADAGLLALMAAAAALIACCWLGLGPVVSAVIVLLAFVTAVMSAQSVGQSGIDPMEIFGLIVLLAVAAFADVTQAQLFFVAGVIAVACGLAGDVMSDFKTGQIIGTDPRTLWLGQVIGALLGAVVAVAVLCALVAAYGTGAFGGSGAFVAAQAQVVATMVAGVPSPAAFGTGLAAGAALYCLGVPAMMLGLGVYLPFYMSLSSALGAVARWAWRRACAARGVDEAVASEAGTVVASGLLGGESIVGVLVAFASVASGLAG